MPFMADASHSLTLFLYHSIYIPNTNYFQIYFTCTLSCLTHWNIFRLISVGLSMQDVELCSQWLTSQTEQVSEPENSFLLFSKRQNRIHIVCIVGNKFFNITVYHHNQTMKRWNIFNIWNIRRDFFFVWFILFFVLHCVGVWKTMITSKNIRVCPHSKKGNGKM